MDYCGLATLNGLARNGRSLRYTPRKIRRTRITRLKPCACSPPYVHKFNININTGVSGLISWRLGIFPVLSLFSGKINKITENLIFFISSKLYTISFYKLVPCNKNRELTGNLVYYYIIVHSGNCFSILFL